MARSPHLFLLLSLFILSTYPFTELHSQSDSLNYEIIEEAPERDLFSVGARVKSAISGYNHSTSLGVNGDYRTEKIFASAGFDLGDLRKMVSGQTKPRVSPQDELSQTRSFHGTFGYNFFQKTKDKELNIQVDEKSGGVYEDTIVVMEVNSKADHRIAGELGMTVGKTQYRLKNVEITTPFEGQEDFDDFRERRLNGARTMFNYTSLHVGASYQKTYNTTIDHENYGKKSNRSRSRIYTHLSIPLNQEVAPVEFDNTDASSQQKEMYAVDLEDHTEGKSLGVYAGYFTDIIGSNGFNTGYGGELGIFPGLKGSGLQNIFLRGKVSIGFASFIE